MVFRGDPFFQKPNLKWFRHQIQCFCIILRLSRGKLRSQKSTVSDLALPGTKLEALINHTPVDF